MIDTAECRSAYGVVGPMPAAATAGVKYRARHDDHLIGPPFGEPVRPLVGVALALVLVLPLLFVAIPLPARRIDRDRERDGAGDRRGAERGEDRCLGR